tara:strand:+ start:281 stop:493 length:213 start_codon:yes stop_codon:yes gene_type:complete
MNLSEILKDKRIRSYDVECFEEGEDDVYLFFIYDKYISKWENGNTITDEKPFRYISDMLKTKGAIIKKPI